MGTKKRTRANDTRSVLFLHLGLIKTVINQVAQILDSENRNTQKINILGESFSRPIMITEEFFVLLTDRANFVDYDF